jgi:putative Mn2+ efflux pump MntP
MSISLDELAIGFTLGLIHLPAVPVIIAIAVQTFVVASLGMRLGARVGEELRENAERLASRALIGLGSYVVLTRLLSH